MVDDTPSGGLLRDQFASALDGLDAQMAREANCGGSRDPAAWHPVDRSLIVVHPSAVGGARFSSPANDPTLRWRESNQSATGHALWMTAVRNALAAPIASPDAPFQALAAFHDSVALLHRARPAATPEEQALLAALADGTIARPIFVAAVLATEDQSPGEASQYTTEEPLTLIVPAAQPDPARTCRRPTEAATPRYEGWSSDEQLWPCTDPDFFPVISDDCIPRCLPRPIPTSESGIATCVATATYPGTEPCPAEFGWLDPTGSNGVRAPRVDHGAAGDQRVCEVRQLEGAALASCQHALDCADCEPGWCATEVPDLVPTERYCAPGRFYPPFRFVLGAGAGPDTVPGVSFSVVCDEASTQ